MKYLTGIILSVVMITACSTPQVLSDEPVEIESGVSIPDWYHVNRVSSSDSTHFNGYSMATAFDSSEAIQLGLESAVANLRFEIDKFAEEVRTAITEGESNSTHNSPQFIIKLRNTVQELPLADSVLDREFAMRDDEVTQIYTRATLNRSEVIDRLSMILSDETYIRALEAVRHKL